MRLSSDHHVSVGGHGGVDKINNHLSWMKSKFMYQWIEYKV